MQSFEKTGETDRFALHSQEIAV